MARIKLELPDSLPFSTHITLNIRDINYGGHMGNETVLSLAHEARIRFLAAHGYTELDIDGVGMIMSDAAVVYQAEAFRGDELKIEVGCTDFNRYGCDIVYRITRPADQRAIALVKTGIVFFDYQQRKVAPIPPAFAEHFSAETA